MINSPTMRLDYYRRHLKIFLTFVEGEADPRRENAIVVLSSLEFQLMESGAFAKDFDGVFAKVCLSVMVFLKEISSLTDQSIREAQAVIDRALIEGRQLAGKIRIQY